MTINEFIGIVASGEISSIDIRKFFVDLSDLDKSDLLQDMFIESLADGLSGHNNEEQRLADAINMLCDVFGWCYESDKKKYIHKPSREQPEQVSDVQTTDAQSLNPEPQQAAEGQTKDLHYYCPKAIEKGYLEKKGDGYRRTKEWTKAMLVYFLGHFLKPDGTFPDKEYCLMFGETRLSKELCRLADNKTGDGKPRGYEIVDELLKE